MACGENILTTLFSSHNLGSPVGILTPKASSQGMRGSLPFLTRLLMRYSLRALCFHFGGGDPALPQTSVTLTPFPPQPLLHRLSGQVVVGQDMPRLSQSHLLVAPWCFQIGGIWLLCSNPWVLVTPLRQKEKIHLSILLL